jgi:hypothetical protein
VCQLFGIAAWVMGNNDLREMNRGYMDPTGRDLTTTDEFWGLVATGLVITSFIVISFFVLIPMFLRAFKH